MNRTLRALSAPLWVWRVWLAGLVLGLLMEGAVVAQSGLEEFCVRGWSSENGLAAGDIYALARTKDGFLWLATDVGLMRFDGMRFELCEGTQSAGRGGESATCLLVDGQGALWAGTGRGRLWQRSLGGQFQELGPSGLGDGDKIVSLAEDGEGALWAATARHGVFCRRQGRWQVQASTSGLSTYFSDHLVADTGGHIWALSEGELKAWEQEQGRFATLAVPSSETFTELAAGHHGSLWVATIAKPPYQGGRVFQFKAGRWSEPLEPYPWPQDAWLSCPVALLEDKLGHLWVGTVGNGVLYRSAGHPWQVLAREGALAHDRVNALLQDEEGTLWLGLQGGQLFQARPRVVAAVRPESANAQSVFQTVCARRDGSVWAGTHGGGVFCYRVGRWTRYGTEQGLDNVYVFTLCEDRQTNLWVGTRGGLFRFDGRRFEQALFLPQTNAYVASLLEDRRGALWVSTPQGLVRRQGQAVSVFGEREGLKIDKDLPILAEEPGGAIWAAIYDVGLFRQVGERFEHCELGSLPRGIEFSDLHFDADHTLWVATYGSGLLQVKAGQVRQWTVRDGLPSNYLAALVEDAAGELWLGTLNGIVGLSRQRLEQYLPGRSPPLLGRQLSVAEGLDSLSCSGGEGTHVAARSADGRLWFPNQRALAMFDPAAITPTRPTGAVTVEDVRVDAAAVPLGREFSARVRSGARRIEFHYTLPELLAPARVRFRYRLEGMDNEWVDAQQDRVADYSHLPPGRYEFHVMASSPEGVWRESALPVKLEVVPRLWERTSVRAAGAASVLGAVAAVVWGMTWARLRRRLLRLEAQQAVERERAERGRALEEERARIARDLHDDLGASLTEIAVLADTGMRPPETGEQMPDLLHSIGMKSRQMVSALDAIVWAVDPEENSLQSLADYLAGFAGDYLTASGIACRFRIPVSFPAITLDGQARHELFLVVKETLHNVVRHAGAKEVQFHISLERHRVRITILDNGVGFDTSAVGNGHGLRNFSERLRALGGHCTIESHPGAGTTVEISLTIANSPVVGEERPAGTE